MMQINFIIVEKGDRERMRGFTEHVQFNYSFKVICREN